MKRYKMDLRVTVELPDRAIPELTSEAIVKAIREIVLTSGRVVGAYTDVIEPEERLTRTNTGT